MVSTDASGQGSCLYGKTRDHVLALTTVLADGTVWHSHPLRTTRCARCSGATDRVGAIHRAVDAIEREHREEIAARFPRLNRCLTGYDLAHIRDRAGPLRPQCRPLRLGRHARHPRRGEAEPAAHPEAQRPGEPALRQLRRGAARRPRTDGIRRRLDRDGGLQGARPGAAGHRLGGRAAVLPRRRRRSRARRQPDRVRRRHRGGGARRRCNA